MKGDQAALLDDLPGMGLSYSSPSSALYLL